MENEEINEGIENKNLIFNDDSIDISHNNQQDSNGGQTISDNVGSSRNSVHGKVLASSESSAYGLQATSERSDYKTVSNMETTGDVRLKSAKVVSLLNDGTPRSSKYPADIYNNPNPNNQEIHDLEVKLKSLRAEKNKKIDLVKTDVEGIKVGMRKDGKKYSVRDDRSRFFYPSEWIKFFNALTEKQKFTFKFLINTGCRINESRHVRVGDIDLDNKRILVRITKVKAKKGEKNHKPRTIPISSQFAKYLRGVFRDNNLTNECYIASSNSPKHDEMPENPKLFAGGILSNPASHLALKKTLKKIGIKDWMNFSVHNTRKSLETWMVALNIDGMKITAHIGHDMKTAAQHYVSADVFSFEEKKQMREIIGDLYQPQYQQQF